MDGTEGACVGLVGSSAQPARANRQTKTARFESRSASFMDFEETKGREVHPALSPFDEIADEGTGQETGSGTDGRIEVAGKNAGHRGDAILYGLER